MLETMKELINKLLKASEAYYLYDAPIMSDKEYDDLSDKLAALERETGVVMSNSPLHKVQGKLLEGLEKVTHIRPMLSADKTKDMTVVGNFISKNPSVQSWKLDGLTIVCYWEDGQYKQAVTRGSGDIGEDVTEAFRHCTNLPLTLAEPVNLITRGECVISWSNFNKINEGLEEPYSHPRNLAAGSVRSLDTNVAKGRFLEYKVFELVAIDGNENVDVIDSFDKMKALGLDVVEHEMVTEQNYLDIDKEKFNPETYEYPVDGTIYKYDSYSYGKKLGSTSHHPLNMLARKWKDEVYETTLKEIQWQVGKTGVLTPVAIFEPVDIDGSIVERASVHNVSILTKLDLRPGDRITVYKANQIIPQIEKNLSEKYHASSYLEIPSRCPICEGVAEVKRDSDVAILLCTNENCQGKLLGKLSHAVSKNAFNIDGMSDATLEFLISKGWVKQLKDLYVAPFCEDVYQDWIKTPGHGARSVKKIRDAINNSRSITLEAFLYAQSINLIGRSASKDIAKYCNGSIKTFCEIMNCRGAKAFMTIDGFGEAMYDSLIHWYENHWVEFLGLMQEFTFLTETKQDESNGNNLNGATFCITGKLNRFTNRDELIKVIETNGGRYVSSVTSKTNYLINNDVNSTTGKNLKAKQVNCAIISEENFLSMIEKQ